MLRLLAISAGAAAAVGQTYDVVVYGATPAGIQTCLAVANEGNTCALVHPLGHIGGMITGGLGQTDIGTASVVGGAAHDFFVRIGAAYGKANTAQYTFEPSVAQQVFASLLANVSGKVDVITSQTLATVNKQGAAVASITTVPSAFANSAPLDIQGADLVRLYERPSLSNIRGNKLAAVAEAPAHRLRSRASTYTAKVFVDGSYEGDLIAMAGISTAWGREGVAQYNESLAGRLFVPNKVGGHQFGVPLDYTYPNGTLLPMIYTGDPGQVGQLDGKVQAYNFRMCLSSSPDNRIPFAKPDNYDPTYWELFRRYLNATKIDSMYDLMIVSKMPNNKTDVNNNGAISTDFIGGSWDWPTATPAQRQAIWQAHKDYTAGFFYFLSTDPAVPAAIQTQMAGWGLAKDEFTDNENWPWQLYVREGRRMVSDFVFTQWDRTTNVTKTDSIGLFSYNIDTHNAQRFPQGTFVRNEGDVEMFGDLGPGQMPYRIIVPKRSEATNVLAPVPTSASHLGYGTIRLEPQFMILGQSAGVAAAQAIKAGVAVQDVDVPTLQARLRALGQLIDMP